jgi:hypothetical protein
MNDNVQRKSADMLALAVDKADNKIRVIALIRTRYQHLRPHRSSRHKNHRQNKSNLPHNPTSFLLASFPAPCCRVTERVSFKSK